MKNLLHILFLNISLFGPIPIYSQAQDLIIDCSLSENSAYPNPLDCNSFIICIWGEAKQFKCPPGLEFNIEQRICDWPNTAKCTPSRLLVVSNRKRIRGIKKKELTTTTEPAFALPPPQQPPSSFQWQLYNFDQTHQPQIPQIVTPKQSPEFTELFQSQIPTNHRCCRCIDV